MSHIEPEGMVEAALKPLGDLEVPAVLRASIDRQGHTLLELAARLLQSGMDESQVRTVIDRACASYRDELVTAIIALRKPHGT